MNNLTVTENKTPIEIALGIDGEGMTTARKLYEFLELARGQFARWAKTSIENNEFYEENKDWWGFDIVSNGNNCKDYKLTTDFAKHLSMESHSAKGKIARDYFVGIEEKNKEMVISRKSLSPELQMFMQMAETMARQELEQKRQSEKLMEIEDSMNTIAQTFVYDSSADFRTWVNKCLSSIAESPNYMYIGDRQERHKAAREESYDRLYQKRPCRLKQRVESEKGRAAMAGASQTRINAINKLSIIENDKDLRPIYETVIKEMMVVYCVQE